MMISLFEVLIEIISIFDIKENCQKISKIIKKSCIVYKWNVSFNILKTTSEEETFAVNIKFREKC